jgi:hypothetical protein
LVGADAGAGVGLGNRGKRGPQPVMKYWMVMPIRLEIIQYRGSPLGQPRENTPRKRGIIHSIMVWVDCCLGSMEGVMVIFCCTQVDAATSTGKMNMVGSGSARLIQRKLGFRGAAS